LQAVSKSASEARGPLVAALLDEIIERLGEDALESLLGTLQEDGLGDDSREDEDQQALLNGVVRIYCTHSEPNFGMPWQRLRQECSSSSGFLLEGRRILTNAHAVEYGSLVQVKKRQCEKKYVANVVAVGHECDLAVLHVADDDFWADLDGAPLKFGQLPDLLEDVSVVGFPVGGESISISSGVVSRIEMQEYAQASAQLLAIQIDAAINPGNSGGPVVNSNNEIIGAAFQSLSEGDVENIGYVVPVTVINHFLDDVQRHGSYSGVCVLGAKLQGMDNAELRAHFGMAGSQPGAPSKGAQTGVLVVGLAKLAPAASLLKVGDVLLSVDGVQIANDGTIPFREGSFNERVQLNYYFTQRFASDTVTLEVLRAGQTMKLQAPLWVPQLLIPRTLLQRRAGPVGGAEADTAPSPPSYLMVGGLVLVALTREYLDAEYNIEHMGAFDSWAEELRVLSMTDAFREEPEQEVVLLSQVLAHRCNIGYENNRNMPLKAVNGQPVKNLRQLKQVVDQALLVKAAPAAEDAADCKLVFEFTNGMLLVLDGKAALDAQEQLCKDHFMPAHCSADLL